MSSPNPDSVKTICPYCGVGCGVIASIDDKGIVTVKGDPDHPANEGRLCSKGTALGETVYLQDRLLYPEIKGEQVSWEQAVSTISGRFNEIIDEHGANAIAFYVSGQLLTEDYYVANKLMKGFIGSANIDTNSRLCMSSAVAAHKRAFGEDCVPCTYEDLDKANLIVLTGSNTAWCHPILFQRIIRAKKQNPNLKVVNIDPRETQTTSAADLQLSLKPGTDAILFNGLLSYLHDNGSQNMLFTRHCTSGLDEALVAAKTSSPSIASVAEQCQLDEEIVRDFYQMYANTEKVISVFSQGINQSSSGVDKGNAIINCHLFTGRIGRPGMGPFSFTGQPNAMGGREVGGLANQLAAHMDIENPAHRDCVQRFWDSPKIPEQQGLKAVDLFDAIDAGEIKAVWIMATNPVVSMPDARKVRAALQKCELVIVSDCVAKTDTADVADILLPALTWGEKDGTVTNTDRHISRQRPFLGTPGQARADWQIICDVANEMGFSDGFNYQSAADIFREHAALSAFENSSKNKNHRLFNLSAMQQINDDEYDDLAVQAWPITNELPQGSKRLFTDSVFSTPDSKARFISVIPKLPLNTQDVAFPMILNTGRVRDHWHTMTRTGVSPRLSSHTYEPYIEIHPQDAIQFELKEGSLAKVMSLMNTNALVRVRLSEKQLPGSVFMPMHWNQQYSSKGKTGDLIPAMTDPISGQPELKHAVVNLKPCDFSWYGFVISSTPQNIKLDYADYWVRSRGKGLWRYELAGQQQPEDWAERAHDLLDIKEQDVNWVEFFDRAQNYYRAAQFKNNRLVNCVFIGPSENLPQRDWIISLFQKDEITKSERASLLSGNPPVDQEDTGRTVCSCFNVGEKTISKAIKEKGLKSADEIGECLQAGTNCGSCLPELKALLADNQ